MIFKNRREAGRRLSEALRSMKTRNPIVIGIARGGIPVAYEVAYGLGSEMSMLVTEKLRLPDEPGALLGCLTEGGADCMDPFLKCRLSGEKIEMLKQQKEKEIEEQIQQIRNGREFPDVRNRQVILVDDGIVTGSTMIAAWKLIRERKPGRTIAALPVSSYWMSLKMEELFDEVVTLEISDTMTEMSDIYENNRPVSQDLVKNLFDTNSAILDLKNGIHHL